VRDADPADGERLRKSGKVELSTRAVSISSPAAVGEIDRASATSVSTWTSAR
jgi:hypothetical protein